MTTPEPTAEHRWLLQFVGEWTWTMEAEMAPGDNSCMDGGTESVRSLGGLWTIGDGVMAGGSGTSLMTLGFDPQKKRFVGSFVASMMTFQWIYDGELDAAGKVLTMNAQGPSFTGDGSMVAYRDTFEFVSPDVRTLTSHCQLPDGTWKQFMKATYTRVK